MTSRRLLALAAFCAACIPVRLAAAQTPVAPGARVRVWVQDAQWDVAGQLVSLDSAAVTVRLDRAAAPFRIPLGQVHRVDVSRGPRSASEGLRRGAKRGLVIGIVLGAAAYGLGYGVAYVGGTQEFLGPGWPVEAVAAALVAGPTILGATWGAAAPGERWDPVPLPARAGLAPEGSRQWVIALRLPLSP